MLTLGLLIPLTAGDYDLSVAYTLTFSAMVLAILNVNYHWSIYWAILAALGAGAGVGFVNGAIVVIFAIDPFIVTLGTGTFIGGIVLWISASQTISGISTKLVNPVVADRFLGIPLEFYYGLGLCIFLWYVFEYTPLGRRLLFVGRGRSVSRLSGIRVNRLRWGALVASGTISAGAGVLYAGTTGAADPTSGISFLLPAYAAAFLGGTTFTPGRFNPWGAFIAAYFLQTGIVGLPATGRRELRPAAVLRRRPRDRGHRLTARSAAAGVRGGGVRVSQVADAVLRGGHVEAALGRLRAGMVIRDSSSKIERRYLPERKDE